MDEAARDEGPEHPDGHDWEVLEASSHSLSPCGSSPRCLSDMEQEQAPAAATPAPAQQDQQPLSPRSASEDAASDASSQTDELGSEQEVVTSGSEPELEPDTEQEVVSSKSEPEHDAEQSEGSQAPSSQLPYLAGSQLLSGASSYADLSGSESAGTGAASATLPESHAPPAAASSPDASDSDAGASESEADLESEHMSESQIADQEAPVPSPDAALEHHTAQVAAELQAAAAPQPAPTEPEPAAPVIGAPAAAAAPAEAGTARDPGQVLAALQQGEPAAGLGPTPAQTRAWLQSVGWDPARRVLETAWAQVLRAGTLLPQKIRAAVRTAMAQLQQQLPGGGGGGGGDTPALLMVASLVLVTSLLIKSCWTAAGLRRELAERDAELNELYMGVLRLSTKLNRSMNVPITSHCAFKTRLSLSGSVF